MKKRLRQFLLVICVCVFAYSAFQLVTIFLDYKQMNDANNQITKEYTSEKTGIHQTNSKYLEVDFDKLLKRNSDVKGWIDIPDSNVSYPILQGETNDTYIHSNIDRDYFRAGSIFIEASTPHAFEGDNTVIYGHNMKNGSMFHNIKKYNYDQDYADKHSEIMIYLPDGSIQVYKVFASHIIMWDDPVYTSQVNDFDSYIRSIQKSNTIKMNVDLTEKRPMILLSTCASGGGESGKRNVVHAIYDRTLNFNE